MTAFDVLGGLMVVFGLLNALFPRLSFRSRWLTSRDSTVTEAGTSFTRTLGVLLVVVGALLVVF